MTPTGTSLAQQQAHVCDFMLALGPNDLMVGAGTLGVGVGQEPTRIADHVRLAFVMPDGTTRFTHFATEARYSAVAKWT
eukprot:COSAG01_NODE_1317_length_10750_cov_1.790536_11_plen_79_part_00